MVPAQEDQAQSIWFGGDDCWRMSAEKEGERPLTKLREVSPALCQPGGWRYTCD